MQHWRNSVATLHILRTSQYIAKQRGRSKFLQLTQQKGLLPHCLLFSTLNLWSVGALRGFSFIYIAISQDIPWMSPWQCFMHFQQGETRGRPRRYWWDYCCHLALPKNKIFRAWSWRRVMGRRWNRPMTRCQIKILLVEYLRT